MNYNTLQPPAHLVKYIRFFWTLECEVTPESPYIHRCLADGCPELLFHYKGKFDRLNAQEQPENCFSSGLQAQSRHFKRFIIDRDFGLFGVYLYPNALFELFHFAAPELTNGMPDLQTVLGPEANMLEEQMMLAIDNQQRVNIITRFLEMKIAKAKMVRPEITQTIRHIIGSKGTNSMESLANRQFLSLRQFERQFKTLSGFSPKLFTRIIRFQSAIAEAKNQGRSLTQIAYDCGYYDQSHFIHDFREFSGYHPGHYFSGNSEAPILY
jgi:AraC-like DNA-binding protein